MTNPTGQPRQSGPSEQTWQQVFGTPGTVETVPRPDADTAEGLEPAMVAYGGGPSFDQRYSTPRLDWTFQSRNLGRHDGHSAKVVVTRNETGLPWTDGWTEGDGALVALITAAMEEVDRPKLPLGNVLVTSGAITALVRTDQYPDEFLERHHQADWGDLDTEDKEMNDRALLDGARLLSAYRLNDGTKIWIITEADRSATTVLLPAEY